MLPGVPDPTLPSPRLQAPTPIALRSRDGAAEGKKSSLPRALIPPSHAALKSRVNRPEQRQTRMESLRSNHPLAANNMLAFGRGTRSKRRLNGGTDLKLRAAPQVRDVAQPAPSEDEAIIIR
jgi:hypothetical protein